MDAFNSVLCELRVVLSCLSVAIHKACSCALALQRNYELQTKLFTCIGMLPT
jgi:hypothetical protein